MILADDIDGNKSYLAIFDEKIAAAGDKLLGSF